MGGCCTATNQKPKRDKKSKSSEPIRKQKGTPDEIDEDATLQSHSLQVRNSHSLANKSQSYQSNDFASKNQDDLLNQSPKGGEAGILSTDQVPRFSKKQKTTYDISPKVLRQFRIYNISNKSPVHAPYSRDTEWQQVLQLHHQKLNNAPNGLNLNLSSIKNKKPQEISNQLEQIQIHREIDLMVKILNLRNRNWMQEQIRMSRRLANMQPGSFDSLVVTREYLQLKEHFNWFIWAVGYYYFYMQKIDVFFSNFQQQQLLIKTQQESNFGANSQRQKQQNMLSQEINILFQQVKSLKAKLPSPINKKWTEGFQLNGVFFRMLPQSDSFFVKNEIRGLKYMQNELMELAQIQNQLNDTMGLQRPSLEQQKSIFKYLILPLLSSVECGGFMIFASPTIYIEDYSDEPEVEEEEENVEKQIDNIMLSAHAELGQRDEFYLRQSKKRSLTGIYGKNIFQNLEKKRRGSTLKKNDKSYSFLQDNIDEIDDPLLKMMPLLRNITKQNVIPIIDFEDHTQIDLNYLLIHVFDCIPSMGVKKGEQSTVALKIPCDQNADATFLDLPDLSKVTVDDIKMSIKHGRSKNKEGEINAIERTPVQDINDNAFFDQNYKPEESEIGDSDFEEEDFDTDPIELFDAKCFTKHGFDIIMISNNIQNNMQYIQSSEDKQVKNRDSLKQKTIPSGAIVNKRAQALYSAREEESYYDGMFKRNESAYVKSIVQFQASHLEQLAQTGGYQIGSGKQEINSVNLRSMTINKKQSILRKNQTGSGGMLGIGYQNSTSMGGGVSNYVPGIFDQELNNQQEEIQVIQGNAIIIANNSYSDFKLKYPLINHSYNFSLEQIFIQSIEQVVRIIEKTDTINNIQSLKDLLHRKGLNLRFQWILLSKLKNNQNRELVMIHILLRTMKKIINEEMKLKSQVIAPNKQKPSNSGPKSLAEHQKSPTKVEQQSGKPFDHFIGNNYETYKDNLVFFSNTLLRRKFSKQKHVFDEALIGLFLNRMKVFPMIHSIIELGSNLGQRLIKEYELNYIESKNVLDDIIQAPSSNPALFLTSLQTYFNVEIDQEYLRKCRQDKYLFLSQLTSQPMSISHLSQVHMNLHQIYSLREYSYFMLANQINKNDIELKQKQFKDSQIDLNSSSHNIRAQIFRNPKSQKNNREIIGSSSIRSLAMQESITSDQKLHQNIISQRRNNESMGGGPGRRNPNLGGSTTMQVNQNRNIINYIPNNFDDHDPLNSSQVTDKRELKLIAQGSSLSRQSNNQLQSRQSQMKLGTPRQFNNIDQVDTRGYQSPSKQMILDGQQDNISKDGDFHLNYQPELIIPSILYKLNTRGSQQGENATCNLLPFYNVPNQHTLNTWIMYLESILKDVHSVEGSEQIILEANNFLALVIYFGEVSGNGSELKFSGDPSPLLSPDGRGGLSSQRIRKDDINSQFDRDTFLQICGKIREIQANASCCSPEVIITSQIICGLSYELVNDESIFPIESEKSYLTSLICLFQLLGDPRGRGNSSISYMLLITWKLSLLSLCTENRKVHDSEFSEELFDATLSNLTNQKTKYRFHQNEKLIRNIIQNEKNEKENIIGQEQKKNKLNSKRSTNLRDQMYQITTFEQELDREHKRKNAFDVKKFKKQQQVVNIMNSITQKGMLQQQSSQVLSNQVVIAGGFQNNIGTIIQNNMNPSQKKFEERKQPFQVHFNPSKLSQNDINNYLEVDLSEVEVDFDKCSSEFDIEQMSDYIMLNFSEESFNLPENPFVHWSIYRQSIQNQLQQLGHKFAKNTKLTNKFMSQMNKKVLETAIDKKILYPWLMKYNPIMYKCGINWKNNQIKQAVFFQTAQMISSRSSSNSKSFQKNESEYSLSLSLQGSMASQGGNSFRQSSKTQHLGTYSSILSTDNGSINKGDIHGVVYSWGSDSQGQLGHDSFAHLTQQSVTQKILYPRIITSLKDEFIKEICCGYAHTLAITIHGAVYSWGSNESCQLGLGPKAPEFVRRPKHIAGLKNIVKLSAGNEHSVAINKNQEIYTWGSSSQTGQNDSKDRDAPGKMDYFKNHKIQQVACGGLHTLVLTRDNKVYCWGSTEGGQLGLPIAIIQKLCRNEDNAVKYPQLLNSLSNLNITQIACGETHSLALCKDGHIYGWGMSLYGQLGLGFSSDSFEPGTGMDKSKVPEPRKIEALNDEQISKIYCGSTFSLFLNKKGELFGCGMNDLGQLGDDIFNDVSALENARTGQMQTSDVTIPTMVSCLQGIQINTVACGEAHVLALDGDGKDQRNMLWSWGQFKNGQLGLGEVNQKLNPRPVQNLSSGTIHKIAAGSSHSLALIGDASRVTTLSPNYYAANEVLSNCWSTGFY